MPKGRKKIKGQGGKPGRVDALLGVVITSDEDSVNDNASIISVMSESVQTPEEGDEADDQAQDEAFEERLRDAVDNMNQKSAQGRTAALEAVAKAFTQRYVPDFVFDRRATIADNVERCLKKGRGSEQAAAAQLATLACVQLGASESAEEVYRDLAPVLTAVAHDNAAAPLARAKCCWALGLCSFLSGGELADVLVLMQGFENIFRGSYLKGNGEIAAVTVDQAALHSAALSAWSLLATLMSPGDIYMLMGQDTTEFAPRLDRLVGMLDSAHLDVRMAAGEAIAIVYELGRDHDRDFQDARLGELADTLRALATDSHKYRAKKDRKAQRSSFRDILHFIEEDSTAEVQVRFGQELLALDSFCRRKHYDSFCTVLGSGMNLHLGENDLLRDVFDLGERVSPLTLAKHKQTKLERHLLNAASFKARTISRSKVRDKRSAVV